VGRAAREPPLQEPSPRRFDAVHRPHGALRRTPPSMSQRSSVGAMPCIARTERMRRTPPSMPQRSSVGAMPCIARTEPPEAHAPINVPTQLGRGDAVHRLHRAA
jgi:hypothetical protein